MKRRLMGGKFWFPVEKSEQAYYPGPAPQFGDEVLPCEKRKGFTSAHGVGGITVKDPDNCLGMCRIVVGIYEDAEGTHECYAGSETLTGPGLKHEVGNSPPNAQVVGILPKGKHPIARDYRLGPS